MVKRAENFNIRYSNEVPGDFGNFKWPVRFDEGGGYVGINQYQDGKISDRVLLSRQQVLALLAFIDRRS